MVISEEPGILVELAMAVSPTLMSRLVMTPSMGEDDPRFAQLVVDLFELRFGLGQPFRGRI